MMKRLFYIIALLGSVSAFAADRSLQDAAAIAADFLGGYPSAMARKGTQTKDNLRLAHTYQKPNKTDAAFYVFNRANGGYVIVSADDRANDILCYSTDNSFDASNINPSFAWWLNRYAQQISALDEMAENAQERATASVSPISPLLGQIAWDQGDPYNRRCPVDQWTKNLSVTGCVATGMAQIMRFWKYPEHGTGTKTYTSYNWNAAGKSWKTFSIKIKYDTLTFDWNNMLPSYSSAFSAVQGDAVAKLMYAVGTAAKMDYSSLPYGSSAWTDDMALGMTTYMDYKYDSLISQYADAEAYKSDKGSNPVVPIKYNIQDFTAAFNASLEAGCPILMGGADMYTGGGHEFVCDGRDENGLFHINWGWGGNSNVYCPLDALKPTGTGYWFGWGLDAIVGLQPKNKPSGLNQVKDKSIEQKKIIINNQLYILHDGQWYNAQGMLIK